MKIASMVAALALLLGRAAPATAFEFDAVMVGGRPAGDPAGPGLGAGIDWSFADFAAINSSGQVGLQAELLLQSGVTDSNDVGVWRWANGVLTLLAREGSQAPGLPAGATIASLSSGNPTQLNEAGTILFRPILGGTANSTNDIALTTFSSSGTPTLVARRGNTAPGLLPVVYGGNLLLRNNNPSQTDSGNILYFASLAGPGVDDLDDTSLWFGAAGSPSLIVREGAPAPIFGTMATFGDFSFEDAAAAPAGNQVAFSTAIIDGSTGLALLAGSPGSLSVVGKQDDPAPGTGENFFLFQAPKINSTGDVAFTGTLGTTFNSALYVSNAGGMQLLSAAGLVAPGTSELFEAGAGFTPYAISLTDYGDVAFYSELLASASVNVANDSGIWVHDDGTTRLAVREGDAAPGLSGVAIGAIQHWTFNDNEDLVFVSDLVGNVTPGVNDEAMWLATADGALTKILQTGDLFDVDPAAGADLRTISGILVRGIQGGGGDHQSNGLALTDNGHLVFGLQFMDGTSGVFVTNVVPEPASLMLVAFAFVGLGLRRLRK